MGQLEEKISIEIKRIARGNRDNVTFPIMTGTVVAGSVDVTNNICDVVLTGDFVDDPAFEGDTSLITSGVMLNLLAPGAGSGMILYPADGANVIVGQMDGGGQFHVLWADRLLQLMVTAGNSRLLVKDGLIQFNDGSKGGLTITPDLVAELDKNNQILTALLNVLNGATIPEPGNGSPSALQTALKTALATLQVGDFSNIENKNVTHG